MLKERPQLRIAVNSRCGRRCFFCRPSGEALSTSIGKSLTLATIETVVASYVECGGKFVKLTGGEPALWSDLALCVAKLKNEIGVEKIHVISRHPNIGKQACSLVASGVDLINISLDTLIPSLHNEITGIPDLPKILYAIQQCTDTGVKVKINTVIMKGVNDDQLEDLIDFCEKTGIQTLKLLDVIVDLSLGNETNNKHLYKLQGKSLEDLYCNLDGLIAPLRAKAINTRIIGERELGHPMLALELPSGLEIIVKDYNAGAWYGSICKNCCYYPCHDALMAIRLTADSRLQFCLLNDNIAIDLVPHLHSGSNSITEIMWDSLSVYSEAKFNRKKMGPF